jgi:hypothetical protein
MLDLRIPADLAKFDALGPSKTPARWLDRQGTPHFRVGSKEWIRRFGAESRFLPGQRVRSLVTVGFLGLREGDEFTLLYDGETIKVPLSGSAGRYVWGRKQRPPHSVHLLMEHQLERAMSKDGQALKL